MPFIKSIASRIFGLALILVCLMMVLAGFLLVQVTALNEELTRISGYYTPLAQSLENLNEAGLRRRIAFERWYGATETQADRSAALAETQANYEKFSQRISEELGRARSLLKNPPVQGPARTVLEEIRTMLEHVASSYQILDGRQHEVLKLSTEGQVLRAADILSVLDELQVVIQRDRSDIQSKMSALMASSTHEASRRHTEVFWTTLLATLTSVLLGVSVAGIVTRRLVQPVRSLIEGIRTVEKGDLSVQLPVSSADEIGALTTSFNFFIGEMRTKEELRRTFGKYIDPRILESVILEKSGGDVAGLRQEMAVSFCDLVGFTEIGEQLTPACVVNLLNRHFTFQAEAIQTHHGVVDKFMGDAVMSFWGPPFVREGDHAILACRAALAQARCIGTLQSLLPEITGLRRNLPRLDVRVGISSGEVIVGNIGSENTRSYTVIGDTVNLASRIEHANRFYGTRILICGTTAREVGDAVLCREVDEIVVKGKSETSRIYELLGMREEGLTDLMELSRLSAAALSAYRARAWDESERIFRECLACKPGDRVAEVFLERIETFRRVPPSSDWSGAWVFDTK